MPACKPKLAQLTTPVTATFPSELSALSARTPLSAVREYIKEEYPTSTKTPITPPTAYMDFLKAMSVSSPVATGKRTGSGTTTPEDDSVLDSAPSTASSEQTDCSCKCGNHKSATGVPPSPFGNQPMSAPPVGMAFPSFHLPSSPSVSTIDSPLSATVRSPFSAKSVRSPFDWEAALKSRYSQDCRAHKSSTKSVRHIREVVTRTVTYTPRMQPAPKGKRRKTTHSDCQKAQAAAAAATAAAAAVAIPAPVSAPQANKV
ncbi:uncharacterized protein GGS25DRAFT_52582 [Hypoxylon fragiforme]|uniref:uncharacterized protein n=1 Tax=Hypoxylon fragiforme TaxID=63214 RepID=UPI0020C666F4|nr:uncharacterized protein GGS25DRAFT_52582 [Hypoxylon fragiforme]KAI2614473.1 hypothetical protein GGS25DRAFT_52582 [Hypoxylon fragiforme]